MNDRFKFRVWDNNKKEYLDKGYIHRKGYLVMPTMKNDYSLAEAEGDFVIEQCTGLKDKNGKLIYEGDIIKETNTIHFIRWDNLEGRFRAQTPNKSIDCGIGFDWVDHKEIIGNIHENPELLKESK